MIRAGVIAAGNDKRDRMAWVKLGPIEVWLWRAPLTASVWIGEFCLRLGRSRL